MEAYTKLGSVDEVTKQESFKNTEHHNFKVVGQKKCTLGQTCLQLCVKHIYSIRLAEDFMPRWIWEARKNKREGKI